MFVLIRRLLLPIALVLAACGQTTTTSDTEAPPEAYAEAAVPDPAPPPLRDGPGVVNLDAAIQGGLVDAQILGNGNSSGGAVMVALTGTGSETISVYVPPGTHFINSNSAGQNMIGVGFMRYIDPYSQAAVDSSDVRVYPGVQTVAIVEAYCLDLHLDNPGESDSFSVAPEYDGRASAIIAEGHARNADVSIIQAAIWLDREPSGQEQATEDYIRQVWNANAITPAWSMLDDMVAAGRISDRHQGARSTGRISRS